MSENPNPLVRMEECVNVIEEHFEKCYKDRAALYAEDPLFTEPWTQETGRERNIEDRKYRAGL